MEGQTSIPSLVWQCKHCTGRGVMKFRESGAAPCRGYGSTRLENVGIDRSPHPDFLEIGPGSRWSRTQRILAASLGTNLLARWVQDRSFTTTSFREPISQLMDNAFVFARHVHGGQLQLHRNKGDLQGFELQRRTRSGKCHGYKDVSTESKQTLTSTVAQQTVLHRP